jgi:signal transduction histidine kinase
MRRFVILFIAILLWTTTAVAQSQARFRIQVYSTEEGLPSNGIKGLQLDPKAGFLWIGTEAGVVRFNGLHFRILDKNNVPNLTPDRISFMQKNTDGSIFIFNQIGKYFSIDTNQVRYRGRWTPWTGYKIPGMDTLAFKTLLQTASAKGLVLSQQSCTNGNSRLWITDSSGHLHTTSFDASNLTPLLPGDKIKTLFTIQNQAFALYRDKSIHLLPNDGKAMPALPILDENERPIPLLSNAILLWQYGMSQPVLFSGEMAWLLDYTNNRIRGKLVCDQIPLGSMLRFAQYDPNKKILFIGTESKGIIVVRENRVLPVKNNKRNLNERTAYYAQLKINDSTILTNENHLLGSRDEQAKNLVGGKFSLRTAMSGDSLFWFTRGKNARGNALFSYNLHSRQLKEYPKITTAYSIGVTTLNTGIWMVTVKGIARLRGDSLVYVKDFYPTLSGTNEPFDLIPFTENSFVFANCNSIIRFNTTTLTADTLFQFKEYCIRSLYKYKDYLFAGTYGGGFFIHKNGITKAMPLDKNKFLRYIHCFVPDRYGYCWMSTNRGLFKASLADLTHAFDNDLSQIYYHYIGRNDGMDITEMNGGCSPCALQLNDNTLSFPTMDGLLWVHPSDEVILPKSTIFIDDIIIDTNSVTFNRATLLNFPANTRDITIGLGFLAWTNSENIYLDYRLKGETNWLTIDLKNDPVLRLSNLSSGSHSLEIRLCNGFGSTNYSYESLTFVLATPWYKQWWFYLLIAATLIALLYGLYRLRTRQLINNQLKLEKQVAEKTKELQEKNEVLQKNDSIKTRLISIISHDIVTPLKFLNVAGKRLLEKRKQMTDALQDETIAEITNTAQDLQQLSTNILNWIKYQHENRRLARESFVLYELVNQALSVLQAPARQKNIILRNTIDPGFRPTQYAEALMILVYNIASNAINFSDEGVVTIACTPKPSSAESGISSFVLTITDEGIGMPPGQISNIMNDDFIVSSINVQNRKGNGLGYLIIKDLLKTMGGSIAIESTPGKGTVVKVLLPNDV